MIKLLLAILLSSNALSTYKDVDNENRLPEKFQDIDINNDQEIQASEVNQAIERFITGDPRINCQMIDEVIDYYFEQ